MRERMQNVLIKKICSAVLCSLLLVGVFATPVFAHGVYTVQAGDYLSKISAVSYGTEADWKKIYNANKDKISDPNIIYAGMKLTIPEPLTAEKFYQLPGKQAYTAVQNSSDSWVVNSYDLITPENISETAVVTVGDNGMPRYNLAWPPYGGYAVETIKSIKDLSGSLEISRVGGNGGYCISYGRNADGTEYTASQRAIPSTSINYRTGVMNIDLYKAVVDKITASSDDKTAIASVMALGFTEENAMNLISDYYAFFKRSEMTGDSSILAGIQKTNRSVDAKYGFYGVAAPWKTEHLDLVGGSTQMNTVFSFGTMIKSGIISDVKDAEQ